MTGNVQNKQPMTTQHSIYFDANVFRWITRKYDNWKNFSVLLDKEEPGLLSDNSPMLFTWSHLLEVVNLGTIMTQIEATPVWTSRITGQNLIDRRGFQEALGIYFVTATEALTDLPALQKDALLKNIDNEISKTCPEARPLIENTLLLYRDRVVSIDYMRSLSLEIAWAFLTSLPFAKSDAQWEKRKICYDSIMALWHRLYLEGHDLVFFRLSEQQYYYYLLHSPDIEMDKVKHLYPTVNSRKDLAKEIFKYSQKNTPLKQGSDLCDGELIHYAYLGNKTDDGQLTNVVGITFDGPQVLQQRMGIFDRALSDLNHCVKGWSVKLNLGRILSLELTEDGSIHHLYRHLPRSTCPSLTKMALCS